MNADEQYTRLPGSVLRAADLRLQDRASWSVQAGKNVCDEN
jgi:hypothetical protein